MSIKFYIITANTLGRGEIHVCVTRTHVCYHLQFPEKQKCGMKEQRNGDDELVEILIKITITLIARRKE